MKIPSPFNYLNRNADWSTRASMLSLGSLGILAYMMMNKKITPESQLKPIDYIRDFARHDHHHTFLKKMQVENEKTEKNN